LIPQSLPTCLCEKPEATRQSRGWEMASRLSHSHPSTPWPPFLLRRIFDLAGRLGSWRTPLILRRVYDQTPGRRSPPALFSQKGATCARCTRSRDAPIRRWSGVMSTWLCAVSLGHGSFWRRGKAWGNARGDQRSDRSGRDVRQDNSEVRRGSHRPAGAILVIARIRLTRTIRANTVVGAKHPIPVVPQTHEGRQRMFRPYRGSQ